MERTPVGRRRAYRCLLAVTNLSTLVYCHVFGGRDGLAFDGDDMRDRADSRHSIDTQPVYEIRTPVDNGVNASAGAHQIRDAWRVDLPCHTLLALWS
jgi:hypothetical protein